MSTKFLSCVVVAGLTLGVASCSGSGGSGGGFSITSCNLGCSASGGTGGQVSCGIQDVFVNGQLRITFSSPVNPSSLSVFSLQVTEIGSGKTPPADRFVDPSDPRTVVYRPKVTFDSSGNPVFGLVSGASYSIKLPGVVEDPGSDYVTSTGGAANTHRMLCTVEASLGVLDPKPGAPHAQVLVDVVTEYDPVTGDPSAFALDVPAEGQVDVYRFTDVRIIFDDVMNPATLVNPVTGQSNTIRVLIDPDGDTTDDSDQQELVGTFSIDLDQDALETVVVFEPELGLPSAGSDPISKRKIVVELPPSIADLGGNPLDNAGDVVFTPEFVAFQEVELAEDFQTGAKEDVAASGADWGDTFPGNLRPGIAGGSGRLGHLFLAGGQVVTLNTDSEDFAGITDKQTFNPANVIDATFTGTSFTVPPVLDGVFEFSSLRLNSGSRLRFVGSKPARLLVRGEALVQGRIDIAGQSAGEHDDTEPLGAPATLPGPSGGAGGEGGRLPTWVNFETVPGTIIPDPPIAPPTLAEMNGQDGEGVVDNTLTPSGTDFGSGGGGLAWPQPTAEFPQFHMPVNITDILGMQLDLLLLCSTKMKGGVGAGGGFGLNGGLGQNKPLPGGAGTPTEAPPSTPGQASEFGVGIGSDPTAPARTLSPDQGWLHGGGGGGGGGGHISGTKTNGKLLFDCFTDVSSLPAVIDGYTQHSSAAGGAGGGGLQLQAGARAQIEGIVDASGGDGGGKTLTGFAISGGGGSGGGVLVQAPNVLITSTPGRIDISGGKGGFGAGGSLGGDGGAGLLRLEMKPPLLTVDAEALKIFPNPTDLTAVGATPGDIISIGELQTFTSGPSALSGVQSCWLRPDGNFFLLSFLEDEGTELGWDMMVLPDPPSLGEVSFRGDNPFFLASLETLLGMELGVSPLIVRFQGARATKTIDNLCEVQLAGVDSPILPGSLTGWVDHPGKLNDFFADPALRPNMIRFQIIFDRSKPLLGALTAVTSISLRVLPD